MMSFLRIPHRKARLIARCLLASFWLCFAINTPVELAAADENHEEETRFEILLGYDSAYCFRGGVYGDNVIQCTIGYSMPVNETISATFQASHFMVTGGKFGAYFETDYHLAFDYEWSERVSLGVDYTHYTYGQIDWSDEPEVGIHLDWNWEGWNARLAAYHNFEAHGRYYEASLSRSIELSQRVSIELGVTGAYNDHYYVKGRAWNHLAFTLAVPVNVSRGVVVTPYLSKSIGFDPLKAGEFGEDILFGGIAVHFAF